MAEDITLENVTQEQFDAAEAVLVDLTRAAYPSLDLRRGTVLRDLLIRPAASVYALNTDRLTELQNKMSLVTLSTDETADPSDVDAILANFGVERNTGNKATGPVMVRVDAARDYVLAENFRFITLDGLVFLTTRPYTVRLDPDTTAGDIQLYRSDDGTYYYFVIDLIAETEGAQYSISQGTALDAGNTLFGFVAGEAYSDFSGGVDEESIQEVLARLPAAVSYRALESRTSIDAKLREYFEDTAVRIQSISSQGYGDRTQLRDKHNPMGTAVGSRVDVYMRTFTSPNVVTLQKTGTLVAPNTYQFEIAADEAPGFYAIRSISEIESSVSPELAFGSIPAIGSYPFLDVRDGQDLEYTFHDIDPDNAVIETAFSVFQKSTVTVQEVPQSTSTHVFKVELYTTGGLLDIQTYLDMDAVRNVEGDYIARCPLICLVGVDVRAYYDIRYPVDAEQMQLNLYNYINSRSFTRRLTRS